MTVLERKSEVTRFQILVEVAASQPQIKQSQIAASLGITPQAVSEYIKELGAEGMVRSGGRGQYTVTPLGVEAIIRGARELKEYSDFVLNNVVGQVAVWACLARGAVRRGESVSLLMEDGILYASAGGSGGASGTATNDARDGEDVGVAGLSGVIPLEPERVTLVKIPAIAAGGSHAVDPARLKASVEGLVGAAGAEALASLRKAGLEPDAFFGATEAVVEAAIKGVRGTLVVAEDAAPQAIQRLEAAGVRYKIVDLGAK